MKNIAKTSMPYIILTLCIGLVIAVYSPLDSGKENILSLMNSALNKTIDIDYSRRNNSNSRSLNKPLNRKVKGVEIRGANGPEWIEFKDSVEEYIADQRGGQYILAKICSIKPNNFNTIFKEELNKKGIICQTGIIYRHNEQPQYSNNDSTTFRQALITQPIILDAKETVSIQAWAKCDWITIWSYTNWEAFWLVVIFLAGIIFLFFYERKRKVKDEKADISAPIEVVVETIPPIQKGIRADEDQLKIYIDDKECVTTKFGFEILSLLICQPNHFATHEQIIQRLWPEETTISKSLLHNRINNHIKKLRETLVKFPGYEIESISGKGFHLITPQL